MKCVLPGCNIKAFGKAIFCLAKLGEDLYFEAQSNGLALKTVNNARSAFTCFLFRRSFFLSYSERGVASGESEPLKCKISNKCCVSVFKALSTLEKTVDHCRILDEEQSKLVFIFHCRHGKVKTHNLGYQETDTVQAVFNKEACSNRLHLQAKILSEVVSNFPGQMDEVTLMVEPTGLRLKNYVDEMDDDNSRVSLTEIFLTPPEFNGYHVSTDASLTFCLKELRAFLYFTETINHSLSLRLETAGRPLIVSIEDGKDYQADMVLATLLSNSSTDPSQLSTTTTTTTTTTATAPTTSRTTADISSSSNVQRGRHESFVVLPGEEEEEEEEERFRDVTRDFGTRRSTGRGKRLGRSTSTSDVVFPSSSQFMQAHVLSSTTTTATTTAAATTTVTSTSAMIPQASHIPDPPLLPSLQDVEELMMETGSPAAAHNEAGAGAGAGVDADAGIGIGTVGDFAGEGELMDALFGEEEEEGERDVDDALVAAGEERMHDSNKLS